MLSQATIEEKYKENIKEKMTGKSTANNFYIFCISKAGSSKWAGENW